MTDMFLIRSHLPQKPISRLILNLLGQKPILPKVSSRCDETQENAKLCSLSGPCKLHLSKQCPHSNKCDTCFQDDIRTLCAPSPGCHKRQLICSFYPPLWRHSPMSNYGKAYNTCILRWYLYLEDQHFKVNWLFIVHHDKELRRFCFGCKGISIHYYRP